MIRDVPPWSDPFLYDLENADDPGFDLGFWTGVVEAVRPRRILELACGTGRLTLPLARLRIAEEVVGLDASASFLEAARARVDREPVRFVEGDMREPSVEGPFDLVVVAFNSLAYLHGARDQLACLHAARALLPAGGTLGFDLVAPHYGFLVEAVTPCPTIRIDADHRAPSMGVERFIRTFSDSYDGASQTLHSVNRYEIHYSDGRVEHRVADLDWHMYFPAELELLLRTAGFEVSERYGGYDRAPWVSGSPQYLWTCVAR
jgi:SAM-dependent methyltransferase